MQIKAELKIKDVEMAVELLRAFLEDFNHKDGSVIRITDGENITLQGVWVDGEPPINTVEALKAADEIKSLVCGDIEEGEPNIPNTSAPKTKVIKEKTPKETPPKETPAKAEEKELPKILEFDEIAKNAENYEAFVEAIIKWFGLESSKKYLLMKDVLIAAAKVDKVRWPKVEEKMNIKMNTYDRVWLTKNTQPKLKDLGYDLELLELIKIISTYKSLSENKPNHSEEESRPKNEIKVRNVLMTSKLNSIFENVDKTKGIKDRVRQVLEEMGLGDEDYRAGLRMIEISYAAFMVNSSEMTWEAIYQKADLVKDLQNTAMMELSTFVNKFATKYGFSEKIKALDFLKLLKENL